VLPHLFGSSFLLLLFFLLTAADTQSGRYNTTSELQAITDVENLQIHAIVLANGARRAGGHAMFLCRLALLSFLVTIICAALILVQLHRIEKGSNDAKTAALGSI